MNIKLPFLFLSALLPSVMFGQSVEISSNAEVCKDELISFESVTTSAVSSYSWDFGDGTSSTQDSPSHTYSAEGFKTVTLSVTFANGTILLADRKIIVHDVPKPDFSFDGSSFCLNNQNICLTDNSTMGSTTNGYASRVILWGDGNSISSTNPTNSKTVCYNGYQSIANNPYSIVIEVVNDKGCEAKWQQEITILQDFSPSFKGVIQKASCDEQEVCFTNNTASIPSSIASFEWDYGDGTTNTTNWNGECHKYTASGVYRVKLKIVMTNGCDNEFSFVYPVNVFKFETDLILNSDTVLCFGTPLRLGNSPVSGARYAWELFDSSMQSLGVVGRSIVQNIAVPCPGDYYVKLKLTVGTCTKESRLVKFSSVGVMATFLPFNNRQCISTDTVYFQNTSKSYPTANPSYFWDFDDKNAPDCFGYISNCNKDSNANSQHFYQDTGCLEPRLNVIDRSTGCTSSAVDQVFIVNPDSVKFKRFLNKPCLGSNSDYAVNFSHDLCEADVKICVDSLQNDKAFVPFGSKTYSQIADPDGWVTVGFAVQTGDDKVYRSADPTDYYLDPSRICNDTFWFHHWFQLFPSPIANFKRTSDTICLPIAYALEYVGGETDKLDLFVYSWDINNLNSILVTDTVPSIAHTYYTEGQKSFSAKIIDTIGCYDEYSENLSLGYFNSIIGDTSMCLGQEMVLEESIRYFNDGFPYWRNASRPEKLSWDLGDGNGFASTTPTLRHTYTRRGAYYVKLASSDKDGCVDTVTRMVTVVGVNAAIESADVEYLCDQILQFKDSSYFDFNTAGDVVTKYHWNFGDFTTPSLLENPFHYYSSNGSFILTLSVETRDGCIDTARIPIYLRGPEPYFDMLSDTMGCVPFTAQFASASENTGSFVWRMGDPNQTTISASNDTTFSFTYTTPGTYYVYLEGSDSFVNDETNNTYTCSALFPDTNGQAFPVRKIIVLPIPQALYYLEDPLCVGDTARFNNRSDTTYTTLNWEIGGNIYTSTSDFNWPVNKEGVYTANLLPSYTVDSSYQRACYDTFSNTFTVYRTESKFSYENSGLCSEYIFTDSSYNAASYSWDFGHPFSLSRNTSDIANPTHRYGVDKGGYTICLTVANEQGCIDSSCANISVDYAVELNLYNIFTPDGDGLNDGFSIEIDNYRAYELRIYNRYGELMFTSTEPTLAWNGKYMNVGKEVPGGTYFYVLKYGYNCQKTDKLAEGIVELVR